MWKFVKSGTEGNCELFNVNVFDYKWENTRQKISVLDPIYNQKYEITVYETNIGDKIVTFAAGEFSNGVYGFYIKEELPKNNSMKNFSMDFRNCVSENEIRNLLREKLNLPEWNDKKPDVLLRLLRELEPCRIYFIGTNLMPENISGYMKQLIGIFDKVGDIYGNIRFYVMDVVTIDFSNVKYIYDIHKIISDTLDFPEWYGKNLDALWDLLVREIPCYEVHLKGVNAIRKDLQSFMQKVVGIFKKAEVEYNFHKIIVE